jgi:hypothetical protein
MLKWGAVLLVLAALPALALDKSASQTAVTESDVSKLRPGQFIWAPQLAPAGPMTIVISLPQQLLYVYRNGIRIGASTVSSGKRRYRTPTGVFMILQKEVEHHSNLYDNAPMPFMQRLTWDGVALHAGHLPGYPASHGCVRLPADFAKTLFGETKAGATVIITEDKPTVRSLLSPGVLNPPRAPDEPGYTAADKLAANETFRWQPYRSQTGPVTIILSAADKAVYVLRSGIVIGRARVEIEPDAIKGTHALTLTGFDENGKSKWLYVGMPGNDKEAVNPIDMIATRKVRIPQEFYDDVHAILKPGANMIVTEDSMEEGSPGAPVAVLSNS